MRYLIGCRIGPLNGMEIQFCWVAQDLNAEKIVVSYA